MSTPLRRLGAIVSGLVLLGTAGAAVAADALEPPAPAAAFEASAEDVPATTITQICAGPPELTTDAGMSADPDRDPADTAVRAATRVASLPRGDEDPGATTLADLTGDALHELGAGAAAGHEIEPTGPTILSAAPTGGQAALAGGATVARADAGDGRGLVAGACQSPSTSTWLVGGSTDVGASAVLVLANVGATAVTVDLAAWGSVGPVDAPTGIVVAPQSVERVVLEGALITDPRLALRVTAAGGTVAANIQTHALDGFVPAGVDVVAPTAAPARELVVPGVALTGTAADGGSAVRLVNPGEEQATVALTLLGADGEVAVPGAEDVVVDPGAVFDVSLAGLPEGAYAVAVSADAPVAAAVRTERVGTPGELDPDTAPADHAWSPAVEPLTSGLLAVPEELADATAVVTNPADADAVLELTTADGTERLEVPARSTVTTPVSGTVALSSEDGGLVVAGVLTADVPDGELIGVLPATADAHEERSIRLDLR